jgi:indole-3-glycerol phosphate synthase/phosphoribosylanthranilate isomerase
LSAARPAAFAGFVFVTASPRHVTITEAAPLAGVALKSGIRPVGVFRNAPSRTVADAAAELNLHAVQLHGTEDEDYMRSIRRELSDSCEIWTGVSVRPGALVSRGGDRMLFDQGQGGSGRSFDWSLIRGNFDLPRSLVAGGIGAHNARAARELGAYGIDVGSALDVSPGKKSPDKIANLFETLRPGGRERLRACA